MFLFVITCPWWLTALAALFFLFYQKSYFEIIIVGFLMDVYYGSFHANFTWSDYRFTLWAVVLLVVSIFLKKRLKFYSE